MELAKYIADKLGVKLQIEAMAFDACMAAISQGAAWIHHLRHGTEGRAEDNNGFQ